jgi:hypothetical protein
MKFFARTPEEKADQAMQIKLIKSWAIMLITSMGILGIDRLIFGKFSDVSQVEAIFFSIITVNFITLIPTIIRSQWKKILRSIIPSAISVTVVILILHRFIY